MGAGRPAGEGDAGDALEIVEEGDVGPIGEELGDGVALAVADFEGEKTVWFEGVIGLRDQAAVDVEAGFAGEESAGGLVIANLGVEGGAVGFGDIRWVADDGVEGACYCCEEVGTVELDAVSNVVRLGVSLCDPDGIGRDIERGDFCLGELEGQRDGEDAGAGAYVEDFEVFLVREELQNRLDEVFGFRARDEDGWGDVEVETVELLLAGDVLDGFAGSAAVNTLPVGELFCQLTVRVCEKLGAANTEVM